VENDASPPSPDSSVSFKVPSFVRQYEHQLHEEEDTEDVGSGTSQVQDFITAHKPKRTIQNPIRFSDMVVAYELPVETVEDSAPSIFREAELSSESEL